jgi:hypothetical protein
MERPTKTEVDLALLISQLDSPTASNAAKLLALEVKALREDLTECEAEFRAPLRAELEASRANTRKVLKSIALLLGIDAQKTADALNEWETEMPKLRATIARVESLTDDVDAKYSLVDDNSCDEHAGTTRLFLLLDDVRAALKGGA